MGKWEYKIVCLGEAGSGGNDWERYLNTAGAKGWRVIHVHIHVRDDGTDDSIALLEREIPEPQVPTDDLSFSPRIVSPGYADPSLHRPESPKTERRKFIEPTEIPDGEAD